MYRLGVDIGGTKINIGLVDENKSVAYKKAFNILNNDFTAVMQLIKTSLESIINENNIEKNSIISCGMGIPGTVSEDGKTALRVPNLNWENAPCAEVFEKFTGIPTTLVQDSRAAALGEYIAGAGNNKKVVICITLGTGIGTGIVIDGKIYAGALGAAGEIGHIPIVKNGRKCGCGKCGCLEKYVAGLGLAMSLNEKMPEKNNTLTAKDVFDLAKQGNADALEILDNAVYMLGNALVGLVNTLSPDILLFSGGMSNQKELFVDRIIGYILKHSYECSVEKDFCVGYATLGEDAPMFGAALLQQRCGKKPLLSASVMCADSLNLQEDLNKLEKAGIDYLHFDVMDGHFVPNLMLPIEFINKIREHTNLPYDIHLMVEQPEKYIPQLVLKHGDFVAIHFESTPHVQRAIAMVKEQGAEAIVAINPSTPIECCRDLLADVSMVLLMTVNPGYAGQKMIPQCFDKIRRMRKYLDHFGYFDIRIEVDGNCSYENVPKMFECGADTFVVGSSSVFDPKLGIVEGTKRLCSLLC